MHTDAGANTTGKSLTETVPVVLLQLVDVFVKVKVAVPEAIPFTRPVLPTEAVKGLLLVQVPPVAGESWIVPPTQTDAGAETAGSALTVTVLVVLLQFVVVFVKVNVAFPPVRPVTTPELSTEALVRLLLAHVPPVAGES